MKNPIFTPIAAADCEIAEMSKRFKIGSPVYVSYGMTGKLEGVPAISTSVLCNPICQARAKCPDSICSRCFAQATVSRYKDLRYHVEDNYKVLNARDLLPEELPAVNSDICRLEAFGDLASVIQARNYLRIVERSPWCTFTLWTKNPEFMDKALEELGRPDNIIFIYSSPLLNVPAAEILERYPWIDHVFTVYDAKTIAEKEININCGARCCRTCMRCYNKYNADKFINEKLK